jgi:predicted transcriptional regulator
MNAPDKITKKYRTHTFTWELVEREVPVPKKHLQLPIKTGFFLRSLKTKETRLELVVYCRLLVEKGWTLQSIANELDVSRERVRQYVTDEDSDLVEVAEGFDVPEIPTVIEQTYVKVTHKPDPQVLKKLLELQPFAQLVRSNSPTYRKEAEEYTKLLADEVERGIPVYQLAKSLGITYGAIQFRLARYGYKPVGNGKSKAYNKIHDNNRYKEE